MAKQVTLLDPLISQLVRIPAGPVIIGDDNGHRDERPAHCVWVDEFLIARLPVTNRQYALYLKETGRTLPRFWFDPAFNQDDQPVVGVSWFEAVAYCQWLSSLGGPRFRLPTEAEREKAMRGGRDGELYPWGSDPSPPWLRERLACGMGVRAPDIVGMSPPNGYGLHDMAYNIHEWCNDWYDPRYYSYSPLCDPCGPQHGERRASRGGAWRHAIRVCRNAARSSLPPGFQYNDYGFRVAADP